MNKPLTALAAATLTLGLAACSGGGQATTSATTDAASATAATALTIGLTYIPDVQFAPFYVAEAAGYFADEGVDVTLRHHGSSEALFGALQTGDEDVVVAGGDEMLQAYASGTDIVSFATLYQTYPVVLAASADSGITELADMAGKTVGVPGPYGESYFGLLAMLDEAGLTEDDLTIEYIGYTQQAAMTTGQVDAVVAFANNDVVRLERAGLDITVVEPTALPLVGAGLGASGEVVASSGDALAGIVSALQRAIADMEADPAAAVDVVADYVPDLDEDQALAVLEATMELYGDTPLQLDVSAWAPMYQFMVEAGLAEADADPDSAYVSLDLGE